MSKIKKYYEDNIEEKKLYQYNYYHNSNVSYQEYILQKRKNAKDYQKKYRLKKKKEKTANIPQTLIKNKGKYILDFS